MKDFNENNPTRGWTDNEKYNFCKIENKWLKELPKNSSAKIKVGIAGAADELAFSSVEEINLAFENDILRRKENWNHLCHICDYATNIKPRLATHLAVHGIGKRFKCDQCKKDFSQKHNVKIHRESHNSSSSKNCNECKQCRKIFKTEGYLKRHIQEIHTDKRLKGRRFIGGTHIYTTNFQSENLYSLCSPINGRKELAETLLYFQSCGTKVGTP